MFKLSRDSFYLGLLFIIWPFFFFLFSLINFKRKDFRFIVPLFFAFIGYTIQPSPGADINYGIVLHDQYLGYSFEKFQTDFVNQVIGLKSGGTEIYVNFLSYFVSLLTQNWRLIFLIWGFILGMICVRVYSILYDEMKRSAYSSSISLLLLISLAMFMPPVFSLNGRFWFACWVFLFYLIQYLRADKLKYVLLPALTLLIHQAFIVAYSLFLIFHFTHKFKGVNYVYYILAILSFLFANIGVVAIFDFASAFGGQYESWMTGYASEEGIIKRAEFLANKDVSFGHWFWQKKNFYLYNSLLVILIYLRFVKKIYFDNFSEKLFQILIVFFIFHNLVESVPDLGDRYNTILIAFLLLILFKLSIINKYTEIRLPFLIILLPLLISLLFVLRMESESLNAYIFLLNPFSFYFNDDELRLINLFD